MSERLPADLTILVVEDYDDMSLAMRLALERQGYHILEAADGAQAVEVAARERPEVILMDLSLPVMDGLKATERIRADPASRDTVIVAVTAHQEQDYRARALAAGCNAFITKPVDFDWLKDLLDKLLA
ncbi:MAG: response regulator [Acidobacteriota bacterium]|nr:response regulator [Acidobacteriota bacterium]MDQ5839309.1 response regulator [Acidobacteriota bacterium]